MSKLRSEQPQHRDAIEKVLPDVEAAFTGPAFWTAFVKPAHAAGISRVSEWLNTTGRVVEEQFGRRGLRSKRPADCRCQPRRWMHSSTRSACPSSRAPTG